LNEWSGSLPLLERVRVEVYLPDPHLTEYDNLLRTFQEEFTYAFGGCTIVRGLEGSYLSQHGKHIPDQVNLIYSDLSLALSTNSAVVATKMTGWISSGLSINRYEDFDHRRHTLSWPASRYSRARS
jgi:hypothetical protein